MMKDLLDKLRSDMASTEPALNSFTDPLLSKQDVIVKYNFTYIIIPVGYNIQILFIDMFSE